MSLREITGNGTAMEKPPAVDVYRDHNEARSTIIGTNSLIASHTRCATMGRDAAIHAAPQESFSLICLFDDLPHHEFWSDEGHVNVPYLPRGSMHIMDLRPSGNARFNSAFDTMNIAIPRGALETLAEQVGTAPPTDLRVPHAWDWRDPIMDGIQASIAHAPSLQATKSMIWSSTICSSPC